MAIAGPNQSLVFLFDIDGTLIESGGAGGGALLLALEHEFGVADPQSVALHGRTDLGIMTELLQRHGVTPTDDNLRRLSQRYFAELPAVLANRPGRVLPGVTELLRHLTADESHHLGVLTGNMPTSARAKLRHYGLDGSFQFGVFGDQAIERPGLAEPAWEVVERRLGEGHSREQARESIVIVGDTPLDIQLAAVMGVRCLAVCTGGFSRQQLCQAGPASVWDDLSPTQDILQWCFSSAGEVL